MYEHTELKYLPEISKCLDWPTAVAPQQHELEFEEEDARVDSVGSRCGCCELLLSDPHQDPIQFPVTF